MVRINAEESFVYFTMKKDEIVDLLERKHNDVFRWLEKEDEDKWLYAPEDKWTVGQHFLHLVQSLKMLNKAMSLPKFFIKYKFGKANRPSRTYNEVVKRYQEKLAQNTERARIFNKDLRVPEVDEKRTLLDVLMIQNKKLQYKTNKLSEKHLDELILPHPLMGKMTLREIVMWTAYHTEHHLQILKNSY